MATFYQEKIDKALKLVKEKYESDDIKLNGRYLHILGVAKMAKKLAPIFGVSEEKAYLAGLFHDYYKYETKEEMAKFLDADELEEAKKCSVLFHSYSSAHAFKNLILDDEEIFLAIKNHVFGRVNMTKLEEILVLSDYVEETRQYENCIYCRNLVEKKLYDTAIYESTRHTIEFIKTKGVKPALMQVEVLNYYKEKCILELVKLLKGALDKVKATDVNVYDMHEVNPFYDYMILASVSTNRQADAVAGYVEEALKDTPFKIRHVEGQGTEWILVDCYDVILSLFTHEERKRVDLDKLYLEVPQVEIGE